MSSNNPLSQIQSQFSQISATQPVMLLPVRLETRYVKTKYVYRKTAGFTPPRFNDETELWVRIYPDDISITTHENGLTTDEFSAGKVYWEAWYAANGDSGLHLGAWRQLCQLHGPERAAYIAKTLQPAEFDKATQTFSAAPT
ncbi:MAG: hypothetical protein AAF570_19155 [Bacteroidota bacterium]